MFSLGLILLSCGPNKDSNDFNKDEEIFQSGFFVLEFKPINPRISGYVSPKGVMWIKGDQLYVKIVMKNGQPNVRYQQYVHKGSACPSTLLDRNGDGVLDYYENFQSSGKVLFPLDKNIQNHLSGNEWFPVTNKKGIYVYSNAASISKLTAELRNPNTLQVSVLDHREQLNPQTRIIIIYGSDSDPLLPIACGLIIKDNIRPWD